jgi:hypothetical protein
MQLKCGSIVLIKTEIRNFSVLLLESLLGKIEINNATMVNNLLTQITSASNLEI